MNSIFFPLFLSIIVFFSAPIHLFCEEPIFHNFLLEYYHSPAKNRFNYSKLEYALLKNYRNIAFVLLKNGENPNAKHHPNAMSPFMCAVCNEDEEMVLKMLEKDADINCKCLIEGIIATPIWAAVAYNKDINIIKKLCESGCIIIDRSISEWNDLNPLSYAVSRANYEKFKILADHLSDEDLKLKDNFKTNIFGIPMWNTNFCDENHYVEDTLNIAKHLLDRGVAIEIQYGSSALSSAALLGNIQLMKLLIENEANVNFGSLQYLNSQIEFSNPIFASLDYYILFKNYPNVQNTQPLKMLLACDIEVNFSRAYEFHRGFSPLGYAITNNLFDAVESLINYGADVNILEYSDKTPLIRAVETKNLELVNLLLSAGADPTKTGIRDKKSPIEIAYQQGSLEILNLLIQAEANMY